ncbi:MAG: MarR family winged helix-turn-helix transcriptional regulator [Granulosicoccus sp.]
MSKLEILDFVPFRLNRLAFEVSNELAMVYQERFNIDVVEWRILVTLSSNEPCSAQHIVRCTRTHKSRISRGVKRLLDVGLIKREECQVDGREINLKRSTKGKNLYKKMEPFILEQEKNILACLTAEEKQSFALLLGKLEKHLDLVRRLDEPNE